MESVTVSTSRGQETVDGEVLGEASSRTDRHRHPPASPPKPYQRCSACRWTELTLLRTDAGYAVISEGISIIDNELNYARVRHLEDADAMIGSLYREDTRSGNDARPVLSVVGRRVLMQAAAVDRDVAQALRGRGIVG